jgi:hypothetical protein
MRGMVCMAFLALALEGKEFKRGELNSLIIR